MSSTLLMQCFEINFAVITFHGGRELNRCTPLNFVSTSPTISTKIWPRMDMIKFALHQILRLPNYNILSLDYFIFTTIVILLS